MKKVLQHVRRARVNKPTPSSQLWQENKLKSSKSKGSFVRGAKDLGIFPASTNGLTSPGSLLSFIGLPGEGGWTLTEASLGLVSILLLPVINFFLRTYRLPKGSSWNIYFIFE